MEDISIIFCRKNYRYLLLLLGACLILSNSGFSEEPSSTTYSETIPPSVLEVAAPLGQERNKIANKKAAAWIDPDGSIETSGDFSYGGSLATGPSYLFSPYSYKNKFSLKSPAVALCANERAMAARCKDGTIFAWGNASYGGDPRGKIISIPFNNPNIKAEQLLSSTTGFAAILNDKEAWLWGDQENPEYGKSYSGVLLPISAGLEMIGPFFLFSKSFFSLLKDGRLYSFYSCYYKEDVSSYRHKGWDEFFFSSSDQEPIVNYAPLEKEGNLGVVIISAKGVPSYWCLSKLSMPSFMLDVFSLISDVDYSWKEDDCLGSWVKFPVTKVRYNNDQLLLEGDHGESACFDLQLQTKGSEKWLSLKPSLP